MHFEQLFAGVTAVLLFVDQAACHFILNYPNSLGFDDNKEGTAPCGSFDVTFNNASDFHVDGDAVALTSTHPQADWSFRATLDKTANGNNWTDLLPTVSESGLGQFCEPSLSVPGNWSGSQGIIQVLQHGDDGLLYQCAAVNFISGKATSSPPTCKNATGLSATFTSDASLPATAAATAGPSGSATGSASAGTHAPSPSTSHSAAVSEHQYTGAGLLIWTVILLSGMTGIMMGFSWA